MHELWVPVLLAGGFLCLSMLWERVEKLAAFEGLAWLPVPAFLVAAGLFPAYGPRPEFIPLFAFAAAALVRRFPLLVVSRKEKERRRFNGALGFSLPAFFALAFCVLAALFFAPRGQADVVPFELSFRNKENGARFLVKVYVPEMANDVEEREILLAIKSPLVLLFPPVFGAEAAETVCLALAEKGFTVASCARKRLVSPVELARRFALFLSSFGDVDVSAKGRVFEEQRIPDIRFLLPELFGDPLFRSFSGDVFLAGYGDNGSALVRCAGTGGFGAALPPVRGIIGIESPLWSIEEINIPDLPLLFLVSDRAAALDSGGAQSGRYASILACLRYYQKPVTVSAVRGAGPLDYAGFVSYFPLYAAFFRGERKRAPNLAEKISVILAQFARDPLDCKDHIEGVYFYGE